MAAFTVGDLGFITAIPGDLLLTPRKIWARRSPPTPRPDPWPPTSVTADGRDHPLIDLQVADYSREFWFDYFRKESYSKMASGNAQEKNRLLAFFNHAFVKPDTFRQDSSDTRYLIPRGPFDTVFGGHDQMLKDALDVLMKYGFSSIEVGAGHAAVVSNHALAQRAKVVDLKGAVSKSPNFIGPRFEKDLFKMVWRGSERTWDNVRAFGSSAAARYDADAIRWNMRAPWNPLSDPATRSRVHFRNNLNDNCLFTTVSVTDDWKCALCYPKVDQNTDMLNVGKAVAAGKTLQQLYEGDAAINDTERDRIGKVTFMDGHVEYRMVGVTRIALMVMDGLVLDTGGAQKDYGGAGTEYPEFGMQSVAGSNVFGMQEFVRVFHGTTDDEGFTATWRPAGVKLATREEVLAAFGEEKAVSDYYPKIVDELSKAKAPGKPVSLKWLKTGTGTPTTQLWFGTAWKFIEFSKGRRSLSR